MIQLREIMRSDVVGVGPGVTLRELIESWRSTG